MFLTASLLLAMAQVTPNHPVERLAGRFLLYEGSSKLTYKQVSEMMSMMNRLAKLGVDGHRALLMLPSSASASVFTEQCYLRWRSVHRYPEMGSRIMLRFHRNDHMFKIQSDELKAQVIGALDSRRANEECLNLLRLLRSSSR